MEPTTGTDCESIFSNSSNPFCSPINNPNGVNMTSRNVHPTPTNANPSTPKVLTPSPSNERSSHSTPNHANPSTPNLSTLINLSTDGSHRFRLNADALPFVPAQNLDSTSEETDNDQDLPYPILQNLRLNFYFLILTEEADHWVPDKLCHLL